MNHMKKKGFRRTRKGVRCCWSKDSMGRSTDYDNIVAKGWKMETQD